MKHIALIAIVAFALSSCEKTAIGTSNTNNGSIKVEELFTYKKYGKECVMNRFTDWRDVYFMVCHDGTNVQTSWQENCGKNCSRPVGVRTE